MTPEDEFQKWWLDIGYGQIINAYHTDKDAAKASWLAAWPQGRAAGLREAAKSIVEHNAHPVEAKCCLGMPTSAANNLGMELLRRAAVGE